MNDLINRQDVMIGLTRKIVSTNPEDFFAHDKFIKFMDIPPIKSYGRWEWANGYNTALVSMRIELDKMPSAEPEIIRCKDCEYFRTPKDENNYCDHDFAGIRHVPFDDDYCSYAERKRDAD